MVAEPKLNKLMAIWPPGTVLTTSGLSQKGFYYELLNKYKKSGWIKPLGRGAYFRPSEKYPLPTLQGALHGMHKDAAMKSIHIGGLTALEIHGSAHFIQSGAKQRVQIFAEAKEKLPLWFRKQDWNVKLQFYPKKLFTEPNGIEITQWENFEVPISNRERAILEFLALVPQQESINHAGHLMEGLGTLRPEVVQKMMENCRSIKAKRLLLAMSDLLEHHWLKKIDKKRIDLGSGPISLEQGLPMHPEYRISVPKVLKEVEVGL